MINQMTEQPPHTSMPWLPGQSDKHSSVSLEEKIEECYNGLEGFNNCEEELHNIFMAYCCTLYHFLDADYTGILFYDDNPFIPPFFVHWPMPHSVHYPAKWLSIDNESIPFPPCLRPGKLTAEYTVCENELTHRHPIHKLIEHFFCCKAGSVLLMPLIFRGKSVGMIIASTLESRNVHQIEEIEAMRITAEKLSDALENQLPNYEKKVFTELFQMVQEAIETQKECRYYNGMGDVRKVVKRLVPHSRAHLLALSKGGNYWCHGSTAGNSIDLSSHRKSMSPELLEAIILSMRHYNPHRYDQDVLVGNNEVCRLTLVYADDSRGDRGDVFKESIFRVISALSIELITLVWSEPLPPISHLEFAILVPEVL